MLNVITVIVDVYSSACFIYTDALLVLVVIAWGIKLQLPEMCRTILVIRHLVVLMLSVENGTESVLAPVYKIFTEIHTKVVAPNVL